MTPQNTDLVFNTVIMPPHRKGKIVISAYCGVQALGHITGAPLNGTDPGPIRIRAMDSQGNNAEVEIDPEYVEMIIQSLRSAVLAAMSRNVTLDKLHPDRVAATNVGEIDELLAVVTGDDTPEAR